MSYDSWKTNEPEYDCGERIRCAACDEPNHPDDLNGRDLCLVCRAEPVQCIGCGSMAPRADVDDAGLCLQCVPEDFLWLDAAPVAA